MKGHFLLFLLAKNMLIVCLASACPCEFSPTDPRPFFEQYEKETKPKPVDNNKKEETHEKNNYSHNNNAFHNTNLC